MKSIRLFLGTLAILSFASLALADQPLKVTVVRPNGGEYFAMAPCPASTITWTADDVAVETVEIRLDRTNDGVFEQQITLINGQDPGFYNWAPNGPPSDSAKVKVIVTAQDGRVGYDVSNNTFRINQWCP